MKWTVELIHDEPGFFRHMRVGAWTFTLDYETGETDAVWHPEWYWHWLEEKHGVPESLQQAPETSCI